MPSARAVVISEATHMVFAEQPDEVNRAIADFLRELGLGAEGDPGA